MSILQEIRRLRMQAQLGSDAVNLLVCLLEEREQRGGDPAFPLRDRALLGLLEMSPHRFRNARAELMSAGVIRCAVGSGHAVSRYELPGPGTPLWAQPFLGMPPLAPLEAPAAPRETPEAAPPQRPAQETPAPPAREIPTPAPPAPRPAKAAGADGGGLLQLALDLYREFCPRLVPPDPAEISTKAAVYARQLGQLIEYARAEGYPEPVQFLTDYFTACDGLLFLQRDVPLRGKKWAGARFGWLVNPANAKRVLGGHYENARFSPGHRAEAERAPLGVQEAAFEYHAPAPIPALASPR